MLLLTSCSAIGVDPKSDTGDTGNINTEISYQSEYPSSDYTLTDGKVVPTKANIKLNTEEESIDLATRSVWISFLEYDKILTKKTEEQFTDSITQMYDTLDSYNINSVIIQARAHGDAYYKSTNYPWARRITGTTDGTPSFDPFQIMVDLANERDYDIHAWINPFRLMEDKYMKTLSTKWIIKKWYDSPDRADYMIKIGEFWWLKPTNVECRKLVYRGVREILNNYDVDALHIDDYFYYTDLSKYGVTKTQAKSSTSTTIRGIWKAVKGIDPDIQFGVSPQGGISSSLHPKSDDTQYTNLARWVTKADYIDYIMPQVYFGFDNQTQAFTQTVDRWQQLVDPDVCKLMIGLAPYKSGNDDKYAGTGRNEWKDNTDIIARQVEYLNSQSLIDGFVLFRYNSVFDSALKGNPALERDNLYNVLTR